jgi:hypothetical protein
MELIFTFKNERKVFNFSKLKSCKKTKVNLDIIKDQRLQILNGYLFFKKFDDSFLYYVEEVTNQYYKILNLSNLEVEVVRI